MSHHAIYITTLQMEGSNLALDAFQPSSGNVHVNELAFDRSRGGHERRYCENRFAVINGRDDLPAES